ncbi:MAG TPA: helix-turn-helix domain-containing protein [Burkholderiales bacterium]|nr:helix-turn-helix domain-containing protein [Burkholderiales bacterium]
MSERDAAAGTAPAPAEEPVGTVLRMAREAAGLGMEEVARQLKFAPRQLDALERGEWRRLPGGAAVRGMVRQYSRLLGLDADAMVARAGQGAPLPDQLAQRFQQPIPFSDQSRRSNLAYVVLSIVLLGVVAAVALQWRHESGSRAQPSFVSAAQQPAEPAKVTPVEVPAARPLEAKAPEKPAAQPAAEVKAPAAAPAERAPAGPLATLVLRFDQESWVEITSGSGKLLVSHLHPAGSERVVTGVPPFQVVIGNAEHVKLTYNDRPVDLMPYVKVEVARFTLE